MNEWIKKNLLLNGKVISKRGNSEWFQKKGFLKEWENINDTTSFLDSPSFSQRLWHIYNGTLIKCKCGNPTCQKSPKFVSFVNGYLENCCNSCAQKNPKTINKIESTNLEKYGCERGLSNVDVISKKKKTCIKNYGVDNPTKSKIVLDRIAKNNMKKFGVEWILSDQDKKEKAVFEKYGVKNVQQSPEIRKRTTQTRRSMFYDSLFSTNRLNDLAVPLFSKDEYLNNGLYEKYKFKCNKCNMEFFDCLEDGDMPRCPTCFKGKSFFEKEVLDYVKSVLPEGTDVIENDKTILNGKELDIYIPSRKFAIECNGLYWHGEVGGNKNKRYHIDKLTECESSGIRLFHILEDEWETKKEIVQSKIDRLLMVGDIQKIYARKCKIREITSSEKRIFLSSNHIQGNDNSGICLGLWLTGKLVAVMTFSTKRAFINYKNRDSKGEYELSRYAALKDCSVIGGAGKLMSHFIKNYNPSKIISYADRRWSNGNLYEKLGFKKMNAGTPNYWYFGKGNDYKRLHRFGFAKHTLEKKLANFDSTLTEWENMQNHGWDRIWDCGSIKFEMDITS